MIMTYYEIWQKEKYNNILPNSNEQPNEYENETERYFKSSIDTSEINYYKQSTKNDGKVCSKDV